MLALLPPDYWACAGGELEPRGDQAIRQARKRLITHLGDFSSDKQRVVCAKRIVRVTELFDFRSRTPPTHRMQEPTQRPVNTRSVSEKAYAGSAQRCHALP